jgi:nucleotide-binding universal stress UspA family protein
MLSHHVEQIGQRPRERERHIRHVLVAFDGSEGAWLAFDRAVEIALSSHAKLTIAAVVPPPPPLACGMPGGMALPVTQDDLRRELDDYMLRQLAAARDEIPATVSVTTCLLHGHAKRELARFIEDGCYDLVVTGPRRTGWLGRLFHRSVTQGLLSRGSISVLAVRPS